MENQSRKNNGTPPQNRSVDALTNLATRDVFQVILEWESVRSRRYGTSFTLILIQIDSFSLYREQNGISQADRVLKEAAKIIKQKIRRCDIAARYAEGIFAVILTNHPAEPPYTAVDRIWSDFEDFTRGEMTLSAGVSTCPRDAVYGDTLIQKAHESLAKAENGMVNRVSFHREGGLSVSGKKPRIMLVGNAGQTNTTATFLEIANPGCEIMVVSSGDEVFLAADTMDISLVIIDHVLSRTDSYEICRRLKEREDTQGIPVIILTGSNDRRDKIRAIEAGADDFMVAPPDRDELTARVESLLKRSSLNRKLTSIEHVLVSMANTVEAKDVYAQGHSLRVADMAVTLGKKMELSEEEIDALRLGGILHDIGKISVPGEILNRPGKLTPDEFEIVKTHPDVSCNICLPLRKSLGLALDVIRYHHEKLDGSGYPDGLKEDEISIIARIAAIVDIFDALISNRPYRNALSREEAFAVLQKEANEGKLDKTIVGHFIGMIGRS